MALYDAGKLSIKTLGKHYSITHVPGTNGGAFRLEDGTEYAFATIVDAMGQRALGAKDFPFKALVHGGNLQDALVPYASHDAALDDINSAMPGEADRIRVSEEGAYFKPGGVAVDAQLRLIGKDGGHSHIYCAALPYLLGTRPFSQGICNANQYGQIIADDLVARGQGAPDAWQHVNTDMRGCVLGR